MKDIDKIKEKDQKQQEIKKSGKRYRWIIGMLFVLMVLAIWTSVYRTMIVEGPRWREVAKGLRPPKEQAIPPVRGNIYSSDHRLLAISPPYYRLKMDFKAESIQLLKRKGELNQRLDALAKVLCKSVYSLKGKEKEVRAELQKGLTKGSRSFDIVKNGISFIEYEHIMNDPIMYVHTPGGRKTNIRSSLYRSIAKESESQRLQPNGDIAFSVIGDVYGNVDSTNLTRGTGGIELTYNKYLQGVPGLERKQFLGGKITTTTLQDPVQGDNVYMTLSMDRQVHLEQYLEKQLIDLKAARGTAVLMECNTGRIEAIAALSRKDSSHYYESYPMAFQDMMEPGSTFKAATMMAMLDDGFVTPESTIDVGQGSWYYNGANIKDGKSSKGVITYERAIAISSNVAMAKSAVKFYGDNPQKFINKLKSFGFGSNLDLEIKGSQPARIKDYDSKGWSKLSLPFIAHGYETQIPPIMMVAFYGAIANGGTLYKPYLVDSIVSPRGTVEYRATPHAIKSNICKPGTIQALHKLLRGVVVNGTGKVVNSPYVSIAGKSGTAQISHGKAGYHGAQKSHSVTFIGIFPIENPRYVCLVNIVSPRKDRYPSGGNMAGPVVREIAEYITRTSKPYNVDTLHQQATAHLLPQVTPLRNSEREELHKEMGISIPQPDKLNNNEVIIPQIEKEAYKSSVRKVANKGIVPNVIGMTAADATYYLMNAGYKVTIVGEGTVAQQSQPAGSKLSPQSTVVLTLKLQ